MLSLTMAAAHWPAPTASACRNHWLLPQASDDVRAALGIALQIMAEGFRISLSLQRVSQHTMSALQLDFMIDVSLTFLD